jgi:hypothetical protein
MLKSYRSHFHRNPMTRAFLDDPCSRRQCCRRIELGRAASSGRASLSQAPGF